MPTDLSPDGFARLHDSLAAHVAAGELPGLVFRIASLTKPIVAAAP
jgi:CubicO group peptidase (beta-lactamase class C family)